MIISVIVDILIYIALFILVILFFLYRRFLKQIGIYNFSDFSAHQKIQKELKASEEKFRTIFENSAIAITLTDKQERIISWNKHAEQLLGMTSKDLNLRPVYSLYPQSQWTKIRSLNIRRAGLCQHLEALMVRKDHRLIDVDISISVLKDEEGQILGSIGVFQDITERRSTERKLKESEERFRTIFNYSAAAIVLADEKERIISWNAQVERLLGKGKNDLYLKPVKSLYQSNEWKRIRELGLRYKGPQHHFESKMLHKNGSLVDVDISITVFKDEQGNFKGSLGIVVDITNRKKIELELRQANDDLVANERAVRSLYLDLQKTQNKLLEKQQQLSYQHKEEIRLREEAESATKAKSVFLSVMSHEIRTPLNSILGFSQLLQKKVLDEKQRKFVDIIESNSQHLLAIVNDLLDFEKAISGRMIIEERQIDLRILVHEVFNLLEHQINGRSIDMSFSIQDEIPQCLYGDEMKIRQVLVNLLSNALKFTSQGFISLHVNTDSVFDSSWAKIYVISFKITDSGIGMDQQVLQKIFQQFTQADSSITRKYGGTGLGLSICKAYADLMQGDIKVESEVGRGSTFIFRIPMADKAFSEENFREFLKDNDEIFKGHRVLVAEPDISLQSKLKECFKGMQCSCHVVSTGEELIDGMKEKRYDICFFNIVLPGINGISAAKTIRQEIDKDIPLIAMGEEAYFQGKDHYSESGIQDFILMPFSEENIAQKLFAHLHKDKFKSYSSRSSK